MAPLLTLITYLVGAALAVGYACEAGLRCWRRAAAGALALALAAGTGQLLMSGNPMPAYVVGIPSLLSLGVIMIAPQRQAPPVTPKRRASDRAQPTRTATQWRVDRQSSHRRTTLPILTDPDGPRHPDTVTELTSSSPWAQAGRAPAVIRARRRTTDDPTSAAEAVPAARSQHGRRGTPRSLSRISRCRHQ